MKLALLAIVLFFQSGVKCPIHDYALCTFTGQSRWENGHQFSLYNCTCKDDYWVRVN